MGHIHIDKGLKVDPEKVEANTEMPPPTNKQGVQLFLGMVTYLSKYVKNFSNIYAPLRELLEKNTEWCWEKEQEDSFNELKHLGTTAPVLQYYSSKKDIVMSVDASSKVLGATLLQEGKPIQL